MMNLLFISGGEIIIVGLVVLLLFGAKSIPDVARMLGKGMNEFKRASDEIKRELRDQTSDIRNDIDEAKSYVEREASDMQKAVDSDMVADDETNKLKSKEVSQSDVKNILEEDVSDEKKDKKPEGDGPVSREDIIED